MEIPSFNAFVLLLYLLPGFLATQLYRGKYPPKRVSQFKVVVWSVLHSFVIHVFLGLAGHLLDSSKFDFLTRSDDSTIEANSIAVLLCGGLAWGFALIGFHWLRIKVPFLPSPDPQAIWPLLLIQKPRTMSSFCAQPIWSTKSWKSRGTSPREAST